MNWIVRYVRFHKMSSREDLFPPEPQIEAFLTDLAVNTNDVSATQNQTLNALVFLYKGVLNHPMEGRIDAVRATKKINVPVVMDEMDDKKLLSDGFCVAGMVRWVKQNFVSIF